jgi:hypothetical protein
MLFFCTFEQQLDGMDKLYDVAKDLADCVVPQVSNALYILSR